MCNNKNSLSLNYKYLGVFEQILYNSYALAFHIITNYLFNTNK